MIYNDRKGGIDLDCEKTSALIKAKRKEKGLTQEQLAQKRNVTEKAVSRWETGRGTPDISLLIPLSDELGISVSELLKGKEDEKENENIIEIVDYIDVSKKKKNRYIVPLAAVVYVILLMFYCLYLRAEYLADISYPIELVINSAFIAAVFFTNRMIADHYHDKLEDRARLNKLSYIMILAIYLIMFFNLTVFGRSFSTAGLSHEPYNLIPFKTIIGFFTSSWRYEPGFYIRMIAVNIIGNIVILMPVQFLIMKIFDIRKFSVSLLIDFLLTVLIEFVQLITYSGIFDIDDIILNILGMSVVFAFVSAFDKKKREAHHEN